MNTSDYDDSVASALQATQVSILSVSNCTGRIVAGEWIFSGYLRVVYVYVNCPVRLFVHAASANPVSSRDIS